MHPPPYSNQLGSSQTMCASEFSSCALEFKYGFGGTFKLSFDSIFLTDILELFIPQISTQDYSLVNSCLSPSNMKGCTQSAADKTRITTDSTIIRTTISVTNVASKYTPSCIQDDSPSKSTNITLANDSRTY